MECKWYACLHMAKTYINTNDKFDQEIKKLQQLNPGFSKSMLIRFAVRVASQNNLVVTMHNPNNN